MGKTLGIICIAFFEFDIIINILANHHCLSKASHSSMIYGGYKIRYYNGTSVSPEVN